MSAENQFSEPMLPLFEGQEFMLTGPKGRMPSYIQDHRKRLRERFISGGATAVPDYELLELILFRSIPRCDVKPVARRLMETFGDFSRVLAAPLERLLDVRGVGDAVAVDLKILEAATHRMARARILQKPVLSSWDALLDYCHTAMSHRETEHFRVLFLDRKNVLIEDEEQGKAQSTTSLSIRAKS